MSALTSIPIVGPALSCMVTTHHAPTPHRYIWHHILPQACGGKTERANLVSLCDNCHYTIHIIMWHLANNVKLTFRPSAHHMLYAQQGYQAAVAAGTVALMPKEAA